MSVVKTVCGGLVVVNIDDHTFSIGWVGADDGMSPLDVASQVAVHELGLLGAERLDEGGVQDLARLGRIVGPGGDHPNVPVAPRNPPGGDGVKFRAAKAGLGDRPGQCLPGPRRPVDADDDPTKEIDGRIGGEEDKQIADHGHNEGRL